MAFSWPEESWNMIQDAHDKEIKKEMKTNRKRATCWTPVRCYPCPNQMEAIRYITPRGKQTIFRTTKKVKGFLWFKKEVCIKLLTTYMPVKENGEYFWKQTAEEEI